MLDSEGSIGKGSSGKALALDSRAVLPVAGFFHGAILRTFTTKHASRYEIAGADIAARDVNNAVISRPRCDIAALPLRFSANSHPCAHSWDASPGRAISPVDSSSKMESTISNRGGGGGVP